MKLSEIHSLITKLNTFVTNGLSHPYHFDESIFNFGGIGSSEIGSNLFFFISFFAEIINSNDASWDAAFCGVTSVAILFANVPLKGRQGYTGKVD